MILEIILSQRKTNYMLSLICGICDINELIIKLIHRHRKQIYGFPKGRGNGGVKIRSLKLADTI